MNEEAKRLETGSPSNAYVKLLIEFGPLAAFGLTYLAGGIFWATAAVMITSVIALVASWKRFCRLLPVPLLPSFAGVLLFGLMTGRPLLKLLLGEAFSLTEAGWRKLSLRWALFFLAIAALNEVVWRNFSEALWVKFKVFGILGLSLLFAMAQVGFIKRHEAKSRA